MAIAKQKFLEELNFDLEWEYAAAIQYIQHAATITGGQYDSIIKEIVIHSQEEMAHALSLSEHINFLGGTPAARAEKTETSSDSKTMLEQDLAGEEYAITRYKERILQAEELREYGTRRILEDILIMEEEHKRDLMSALGKIGDFTSANRGTFRRRGRRGIPHPRR